MKTQCPHCHTFFNVTDEQIEQADSQVRCGHCLAIFNATIIPDDRTESDHKNQDQLPFSIDDIPAITTNDQDDTPLPDVVPPELRVELNSKKKHYSFLNSFLWMTAILAMIIAGIIQYAYYERVQLVKYNELRPWMEKLCIYAKCELPEPRDPARIKLTYKNIFSHPNQPEALMISATIVNQAEFAQNFPLMDIVFSNIRGEDIAGRRFQPEEYLNIPANQIGKMEPGEPVSFNIEIVDSGTELMSYKFNFL